MFAISGYIFFLNDLYNKQLLLFLLQLVAAMRENGRPKLLIGYFLDFTRYFKQCQNHSEVKNTLVDFASGIAREVLTIFIVIYTVIYLVGMKLTRKFVLHIAFPHSKSM